MMDELKEMPFGVKSIIVFYHDGYFDDGGCGVKLFSEIKDAEEFIRHRMKNKQLDGEKIKTSDYDVFYGERLLVQEIEVVKEIRIVR